MVSKMKNTKTIADASKNIITRDRNTWITIYYSISEDAVYTEPTNNAIKVSELINPNTEQDIIDLVEWWKKL